MAQTCKQCKRANPAEATYCYFDGFVLTQHGHNGSPLAIAAQQFGTPFVFPTGRSCQNFNELSLACQEDWGSARELLDKGHMESFLDGLGRVDLAHAAREARRFPDRDVGLDQLLSQLPNDVLTPPKLLIEPLEIGLGVLTCGDTRQFDLHMENRGMRFVHGSISCTDGDWLTFGDAPGVVKKHFQFGRQLTMTVKLVADRLRAASKPIATNLLIESNGGTVSVAVRAEVPITPFPAGALGGSRSPRQVAEKAKANPRDAAVLFENGAVANWYKTNGWKYPVQGPAASGLGAVQQFFEALGLTPPPKVEINKSRIDLTGSPGQKLSTSVELRTQEKRPIYAHAVSSEPWLEVGRPRLTGRVALINMSVPTVPGRAGQTLTAQLTVQSNGTQRFVVPVRLTIGEQPPRNAFNFSSDDGAAETMVMEAPPTLIGDMASVVAEPVKPVASRPVERSKPAVPAALLHVIPAVLLLLVLGGIGASDVFSRAADTAIVGPPSNRTGDPDNKNGINWKYNIDDRDPRIGVDFNTNTMRFGIVMLKEQVNGEPKKLTFSPNGATNNVCIQIDGSDHLFGKLPFVFEGKARLEKLPERLAWRTVMVHPEKKIRVTQYVEIVPGEQSRLLDTCLVYFTVENFANLPRTVGFRVMLDTFIGANDGVPFVIPGQPDLMRTARTFSEKEIPDYIEALEFPDLARPGTVAHLGLAGLKLPGVELEPINRMVICHWPEDTGSETRYELSEADRKASIAEGDRADSCVLLYWSRQKMSGGSKREMAFTYGLGKIAVEADSGSPQQIGLTAGGAFRPGGEFTVLAYLKNAKEGQKVTIKLPDKLRLTGTQEATQTVPLAAGNEYSQVSWRVTADATGDYKIQATSEEKTVSHSVKIKTSGLFD